MSKVRRDEQVDTYEVTSEVVWILQMGLCNKVIKTLTKS
jgi:hypothetical protein